MEFLKVENQNDLDALPSGKWGIREPSYESDAGPRVNGLFESVAFSSASL